MTNSAPSPSCWTLALLLLLGPSIPVPVLRAQTPDIRVDPRVELLSLVFRLAGAEEYNQCDFPRYQAAADAWFAPHANHRVIELTRQVRREAGVGFDAVQSMAVHLGPLPDLAARVDFSDTATTTLERRWWRVDRDGYLAALREFARESRFADFMESQRALSDLVVGRLDSLFQAEVQFEWFERFFGARPAAHFQLTPGLCNGSGNFGPLFRGPDGREELYAIISVGRVDTAGVPQFPRTGVPTIVHEFNHSYVNPVFKPVWGRFQAAANAIYPHVAEAMRGMAYGTGETMLNESMVRAGVVRYILATAGREAADAEITTQIGNGFLWMGELSDRLAEYEAHRATWPTFSDFLPRLAQYWDSLPPRVDSMSRAFEAQRPTLIAMTPADGATEVDPATTRVTLQFDRPMRGGWGFDRSSNAEAAWPAISELAWDTTRTTLTFSVRLEPGRRYEMVLVGTGFRSADLVPLRRRVVGFRTRP